MASLLGMSCSTALQQRRLPRGRGMLPSSRPLAPPRGRRVRPQAPAAVLGATEAAVLVARAMGFGLAAVWVGLQLAAEQEQARARSAESQHCAQCAGTGEVPCICTRWSDKDVGCGMCEGSGRMECPYCGGGGTAVPLMAKVYVTNSPVRHYR